MIARIVSVFSVLVLFAILYSLLSTPASAQDDAPDLAPPPLKAVSKDERSRLDAQGDQKSRTKLALEMMQARISNAERLATGEDFDGVFRELGGFQGLMDNSLEWLNKNGDGSGKTLDNYKRIEIALRGFAPRVEAIRRDVPLRYEDYIRRLLMYLRDARAKAIEPLFSDTVVPNQRPNP